MIKSYKFRLSPTKGQSKAFEETLYLCRQLYPCSARTALQERRDAYRKCGVNVTYRMQQDSLPEVKAACPEYKAVHSQVLQMTLRRLDNAFQGFFRRVKAGQAPGFPRFQGRNRFDSFCYPQYTAILGALRTDAKHVYVPKLGNVRIRLHRPIEGRIETATVKREGAHWYVIFTAEVEPQPLPPTGNEVGIDLGLQHLIVTSDGEFVDPPRFYRAAQKKLRVVQRSLNRKKRGSKRREKARQRVAKTHLKVKRQRADFLHKLSRKLVNENDVIAHEALSSQGLARTRLAKSVHDASWGSIACIHRLQS